MTHEEAWLKHRAFPFLQILRPALRVMYASVALDPSLSPVFFTSKYDLSNRCRDFFFSLEWISKEQLSECSRELAHCFALCFHLFLKTDTAGSFLYTYRQCVLHKVNSFKHFSHIVILYSRNVKFYYCLAHITRCAYESYLHEKLTGWILVFYSISNSKTFGIFKTYNIYNLIQKESSQTCLVNLCWHLSSTRTFCVQ